MKIHPSVTSVSQYARTSQRPWRSRWQSSVDPFTTRQPVLSQTLVNLYRMLFLLTGWRCLICRRSWAHSTAAAEQKPTQPKIRRVVFRVWYRERLQFDNRRPPSSKLTCFVAQSAQKSHVTWRRQSGMRMQPCIPPSEQRSHLVVKTRKKLPYQPRTTACSLGREGWARPHWANVPLQRRSANPETPPREKITIRFVFFIVAKAAARAACDRAQLPQKSLMQIRRPRAAVLEVAGQPVPRVLLFFKSESWRTLM